MELQTNTIAQSVATLIGGEGTASNGAPAKRERVKAMPYSDAQAFAFWTAKSTEDKAGALWLAIAPMLSAYLINGGTAASLKGDKGASFLGAHIHANKGKRNAAARAVFAECLQTYKARACEYDEEGHEAALWFLEQLFLSHFVQGPANRKQPATRYTVAQLVEAIQGGQLAQEDMQAIASALPLSIVAGLTAKPAKPAKPAAAPVAPAMAG